MKVPVSWLREYVDFDLPVEELARQLVFTSCEVDRIVRRGVPGGARAASRSAAARMMPKARSLAASNAGLTSTGSPDSNIAE